MATNSSKSCLKKSYRQSQPSRLQSKGLVMPSNHLIPSFVTTCKNLKNIYVYN